VKANLLDLNLELAELEAEGQAIVGPWDPTDENSLRLKRTRASISGPSTK
jgi:hypothetical protein